MGILILKNGDEFGGFKVGFKQEIFDEFFEKLENDDEIPDSIINELKNLIEIEPNISKESILDLISMGANNED